MKKLRLGLIGASNSARKKILDNRTKLANKLEVLGVAAKSPSKAKRYAKKFDLQNAYVSYAEMISSSEIDAVYISLPPSLHSYWIRQSLNANKHVLVEKPFTNNAKEARECIEVANQQSKILMEANHMMFTSVPSTIKKVLPKLGKLRYFEDIRCHHRIKDPHDIRFNVGLGGGAFLDCGCYSIMRAIYLFGWPIHVIDSIARDATIYDLPESILPHASECDVLMETRCEFKNGLIGKLITCPFHLPHRSNNDKIQRFTVYGEMAKLVSYERSKYEITDLAGNIIDSGQFERGKNLLLNFIDSCFGYSSPIVSLVDSQRTMAVIDDVYKKSGLTIRGCTITQY